MSLRENLEYYQLTVTCDEKGYPMMVVHEDHTLIDLENKTHNKYFSNVFMCSRETEEGFIPVLIRDAYMQHSGDPKPTNGHKLIYVSNIIGDPDYQDYIRKAARNTLQNILNDENMLLYICNEDLTKAYTFRNTINDLVKKL
jgi:hypothetical protein